MRDKLLNISAQLKGAAVHELDGMQGVGCGFSWEDRLDHLNAEECSLVRLTLGMVFTRVSEIIDTVLEADVEAMREKYVCNSCGVVCPDPHRPWCRLT